MFHTIVSIKNDGHYFCRAGGNRPDGLNEPVTDMSWMFELVRTDGNNWFVEGQKAEAVKSGRSAAVFEIGRLLVEGAKER
ncbi:hypothetical protein C9198_27035 (plasmid) [Escherichia coli]|nr:hypothetical protein [Salmonella enterica subsp. enterica serovar Monschaui]TJF22132.1 hypothetical protein C9198_27035 [Escherichia coli]